MTQEQPRDKKGQFKKSKLSTWFKRLLGLAVISLLVYVGYKGQTPPVTSQDAPQATIAPRDEESTIMDENDAKKVELYKKKVILERKKKTEVERHEKVMAEEKALNDSNMKSIEAELETVRGEEMSFQ